MVSSEDSRGNLVKKEVFKDVPAAFRELMDPTNFEFTGPSDEDMGWIKRGVGKEYLFDGELKGKRFIETIGSEGYVFRTPLYSIPNEWILDIKEERVLAGVKIYAPLHVRISWEFNFHISRKLPNHVKVYGSIDGDNWEELAEFYQASQSPYEDRWCFATLDNSRYIRTNEELEAAEPCFMDIGFDLSENKYRYLKIEILELFEGLGDPDNQVVMSELEVYVKKED